MLLANMEKCPNLSLMTKFCDVETFAFKFKNGDKIIILLQLFYDGMGTSNPLHGQSSLSNIGVFYYVIKNLRNKINTCYAYVHRLCLVYSQDLKVYGFNPVLDKFAHEINKLTARSFEGEFPNTGKQRAHVQLCQVTCDNLALNGIFRFLGCFAWDFLSYLLYKTRGHTNKI